jgi:hypothetical protein
VLRDEVAVAVARERPLARVAFAACRRDREEPVARDRDVERVSRRADRARREVALRRDLDDLRPTTGSTAAAPSPSESASGFTRKTSRSAL